MSFIVRLRESLRQAFSKYLLATNVATCGALLGLGDFIVQEIESYNHLEGTTKPYDYHRTARMMALGFIMGPFNHYWYSYLDKIVIGNGIKVIGKKILADQFVAGPFFCSSFLIGMELLEGNGLESGLDEWRMKFISIYKIDWLFWPAAQLINFSILPPRFRVVYVSTASLIWNAFLSYMKHRETEVKPNSGLIKSPSSYR